MTDGRDYFYTQGLDFQADDRTAVIFAHEVKARARTSNGRIADGHEVFFQTGTFKAVFWSRFA